MKQPNMASTQGASTRVLGEMRPPGGGGCTHVAVLCDIPVFAVCATSLQVLSVQDLLYSVFISTLHHNTSSIFYTLLGLLG